MRRSGAWFVFRLLFHPLYLSGLFVRACVRVRLCVVRVLLPAPGAVTLGDVTLGPRAVVRLQDTHAPTGQAVHGHVAGPAAAPRLPAPAAQHAAGKAVARQELAGVGLIGCGREGGRAISIPGMCVCVCDLQELLRSGCC